MDNVLMSLLKDASAKSNYGKQVLKTLHNSFGFDYNKPIITGVKRGESITPSALARDFGIDYEKHIVVVVFEDTWKFYVARMSGGGLWIDVDAGGAFWRFYYKKDAEEKRKSGCKTYIIAQERKYLKKIDGRRHGTPDLLTRYTKGDYDYYFDNGRDSAHRMTIWGERFDASGYCVSKKREDLQEKLSSIKKERQANAYKAMTNTQDMIDKARKAIEAKREELSKRVLEMTTSEEAEQVKFSIGALVSAFTEIECIAEKDKVKSFESPRDFNLEMSWVYSYLSRV